jgi:voltage-gated potassium channel
MTASTEGNLVLINPNWSAFVLLVTLLAAFNSLALLVLPLSDEADTLLRFNNVTISLILWGDFFYLLWISRDKRRFMGAQRGWMVLVGSMPLFRALRILWFQRTLKSEGYKLRDFLKRIVIRRNAEGTLLLILFTAIVVFQFAIASILSFESTSSESNIKTIADAIWWAFATVTTVGYGDTYPVTDGGRLIAILLMAVGIALFTVITGSLVQWFRQSQSVQPLQDPSGNEFSPSEKVAQLSQLLNQQEEAYQQTLAELRKKLVDLEASLPQ